MGASRRPAPPSVDWVLPPCVVGILRHYRETVDSRWMFPSPVKEDVPMTLGGGAPATPDHSGAGRVQKNQISRFTPHLFHLALRERHGCEAPLRHAGPCIGGHYPEHLYPCHRGYAERDGDQDRPGAGQRGGGYRPVGAIPYDGLPARRGDRSGGPVQGASPRSTTTCLRAATPPSGRTAHAMRKMSMRRPGRSARKS